MMHQDIKQQVKSLQPEEAYREIAQGALLIDVRHPKEVEFVTFQIDNRLEISLLDLVHRMNELPEDCKIITADFYGVNGFKAANMLQHNGFENVSYIHGGMKAWALDGFPLKYNVEDSCSDGSCGGCTCC
ncbi:MAG: rhodanese-like domain-containing protein [Bacteroidota bacterium]